MLLYSTKKGEKSIMEERDVISAAKEMIGSKDFSSALNLLERAEYYYPEYYKARFELGKLYNKLSRREDADKCLTKLLSTPNWELGNLEMKRNNIDKSKKIFTSLLSTTKKTDAQKRLISIDIMDEKYESAYERFKSLGKKSYRGKRNLEIFLKTKLNLDIDIDENNMCYLEKQITNYSEFEALKHICKHFSKQKEFHNSFLPNVDIINIFNTVPLDMLECTTSAATDVYEVEMGNEICEDTNILKIVTIANTHNIITMFPERKDGKDTKEIENLENECPEEENSKAFVYKKSNQTR
jgi:tetratricopeptide (TPR) repeat protein